MIEPAMIDRALRMIVAWRFAEVGDSTEEAVREFAELVGIYKLDPEAASTVLRILAGEKTGRCPTT